MHYPFDEESLMFQTDWDSIGEWFERRAAEAGKTGWDKYTHGETFTVAPSTPEMQRIEKAVSAMSYNLGRSISDLCRACMESEQETKK